MTVSNKRLRVVFKTNKILINFSLVAGSRA
jgi:hypothetical protein